MKLANIEHKCKELNSIREQLKLKKKELQKLESASEKARETLKFQKEMAEIRGEEFENEYEPTELTKIDKEIEDLERTKAKLERETLEGLKSLKLDVLDKVSEVEPEGKVRIDFKADSCNNAITFICSLLSSDIPLTLDNVLLYPDRVVVTNIQQRGEVPRALKGFLQNINRIACVSLKENVSDVQEVSTQLHDSKYKDVWENIGGRRVSLQDLYSQLNLQTSKEKKRIRNFFVNMKKTLKEKCPFHSPQSETYELTFFGKLVWKRYKDDYLEKEKSIDREKVEKPVDKEEFVENAEEKKANRRKATLNSFLSNDELRDTVYGKKVK